MTPEMTRKTALGYVSYAGEMRTGVGEHRVSIANVGAAFEQVYADTVEKAAEPFDTSLFSKLYVRDGAHPAMPGADYVIERKKLAA